MVLARRSDSYGILIRLRLHVRDGAGHEFPIAFYPEGREQATPEQYKIGRPHNSHSVPSRASFHGHDK